MFALVIGGGHIGSAVASRLAAAGHRVTVVEKDPERCAHLRTRLNIPVLCGDGDDPRVLQEAGVRQAGVVLALTGDDEDNLVIGILGKSEFQVPRIIARINHPKNAWLFTPAMGIDVAFDAEEVVAARIVADYL